MSSEGMWGSVKLVSGWWVVGSCVSRYVTCASVVHVCINIFVQI